MCESLDQILRAQGIYFCIGGVDDSYVFYGGVTKERK